MSFLSFDSHPFKDFLHPADEEKCLHEQNLDQEDIQFNTGEEKEPIREQTSQGFPGQADSFISGRAERPQGPSSAPHDGFPVEL